MPESYPAKQAKGGFNMWFMDYIDIKFKPKSPFQDSSLTIGEVAHRLRTSVGNVRMTINDGSLHPEYTTSMRYPRIRESELYRFIKVRLEEYERWESSNSLGKVGLDN
jgi:hypothetical protein